MLKKSQLVYTCNNYSYYWGVLNVQSFSMNNKNYELVATAQDQSIYKQGKMAVYRIGGTNEYFVCPIAALLPFLSVDKKVESRIAARLDIYKDLFVGREDVYAHRYFNKNLQKDMYAPVTQFKNGQPIKGQKGWIPLTDEALISHLDNQKREFIGLYPMYEDSTCKFVVIDIDKQNWQEICNAIRSVCTEHDIPILVEISQSGKGCHMWIFFDGQIKANKARKLADEILQASMEYYPALPFSAFDRIFPSQDFIQKDKLGNLIAAPLQGQRRKQDRTVFVDESFVPYKSQWKTLANVNRLNENSIDRIIANFEQENQIEIHTENQQCVQGDLFLNRTIYIESLEIIKSNMLYVSKKGLSAKQISYLKTLGAFWNPQFFQRQKQRLSIYKTPRVIDLSADLSDYVVLPRGVEDELNNQVAHIDWKDQTVTGNSIEVCFNGKLKKEQKDAQEKMMTHSNGILAARTGFGKTVIAASIIAEKKISTLILVNNRDLAQQWVKRLKSFLEISSAPVVEKFTATGRKRKKDVIGKYCGTKHNRSGIVDVATTQSFKGTKKDQEILDNYGMVIFDEVHHLPAFSYDSVFKNIRSRYIYGLSATPYRRDGLSKIITLRIGQIRYQTGLVDGTYALKVKRAVIPRFTEFGLKLPELKTNSINDTSKLLANDVERNKNLIKDIQKNIRENRHVLLLTHRLEHIEKLEKMLGDSIDYPIFKLYGAQGAAKNNKIIEEISSTKSSFVILATAKYAGEGMDIGNLDTIILAMPNSWKGTIFQYLGRLNRNLDEKKELRVYDYVDMLIPIYAKMYQKRKRAYKELEYKIQEDKDSFRSDVDLYEGNYHLPVLESLENANKVMMMTSFMSPFVYWKIVHNHNDKENKYSIILNTISDFYKQKLKADDIEYTLTENNMPECILIDNQKLWLCSDKGFNSNKGIAICITSPDIIHGFKKIIQREK